MWEVIGVIVGTAAIGVIEVRKLAAHESKGERRRNIGCFLTLLLLSSGLLAAVLLHARLPNPLLWIQTVLRAVGLA